LLLLPLATALVIVGLTIPEAPAHARELFERAWVALLVAPGVLFFVWLCRAAAKHHWRRVVFWLVGSVLAASLIATLTLLGLQRNGEQVFLPGERYSWDGWWWIWFAGVYACGWLMLIELSVHSRLAGLGARLLRGRVTRG
jgi:hypothetical protein